MKGEGLPVKYNKSKVKDKFSFLLAADRNKINTEIFKKSYYGRETNHRTTT